MKMSEVFEVAELAENFTLDEDNVISEPRLKYKLLSHGISTLTSTDTITCLASHNKFLAIGTVLGRLHILDHEGFEVENGVHSLHRGPVNQISISVNGDFLASCSDDARVAIYNLSNANENEVFSMSEEVKSVAISPDYSRSPVIAVGHSKLLLLTRGMFKRSKHGEIVKAEGQIRNIKWRGDILVWADDARVGVYDLRDNQHISFVQFSQQTSIYTRFIPCHINWCTDTCFLIGRGNSLRICQILERYQTSERRSSSRGSFSRSSSIHLPSDSDTPMGLTNRYLELSYQIDLVDCLVCGLSRHQTQLLALVVPDLSVSSRSNVIPLEVRIFDVDDMETVDTVIRNPVFHKEHQRWTAPRGPRGYACVNLESVPQENTHYIMTPRELICAEELTPDDRVDWLLSQNMFAEALQLASDHPKQLQTHSPQSVGLSYVEHLLEQENYDSAARVCAEAISDKLVWEQQIHLFLRLGQLSTLLPFIPIGIGKSSIILDASVYETILINFMDHDPAEFLNLLSSWSKHELLNSYDGLLRTLLDRIARQTPLSDIKELGVLEPSLRNLWRGLAMLYELTGSPEKSFDILVQLHDPKVFDLFERRPTQTVDYRLLEVLKERVDYFMQLSPSKAVAVLLDLLSQIPVDHVVSQLDSKPELLYHYLDAAYLRYPKLIAPYTTHLIQLYTRFGREKLLPLLRSTDSYRLSEALAICERANLVPETVYLLTRVGRRHDALNLIMTKGGTDGGAAIAPSIEEQQSAAAAAAIAYCCEEDAFYSRSSSKFASELASSPSIFGLALSDEGDAESESVVGEEHDGELWQQVVLFAVDKPAFICALLQHAGSEGLDPRLLLRKISPDLSIPGLRDSLVKLLQNCKLQLELQRNCRQILRHNVHKLFKNLLTKQPHGIRIQPNGFASVECSTCSKQLVKPRTNDLGKQIDSLTEAESMCVVFRCRHIFHATCLTSGASTCPLCSSS